jgi:hypothetical protein
LRARFNELQAKRVMNETAPSMLSQIDSRSLAPYVLTILDFYLSHVSRDRSTKF